MKKIYCHCSSHTSSESFILPLIITSIATTLGLNGKCGLGSKLSRNQVKNMTMDGGATTNLHISHFYEDLQGIWGHRKPTIFVHLFGNTQDLNSM
ncbi:hypothetical protein GDO81_028326 [Engystomops pustulosus]|uniref:Uncharacterized protein n=1 Tax=Engystomops pustulosus TaxID=76066 RepID=A0AAV6ZD86_ENGPU|nr:hypothetical protein GDO81_028326 [Engystomops pustulosus]